MEKTALIIYYSVFISIRFAFRGKPAGLKYKQQDTIFLKVCFGSLGELSCIYFLTKEYSNHILFCNNEATECKLSVCMYLKLEQTTANNEKALLVTVSYILVLYNDLDFMWAKSSQSNFNIRVA